MGIAVAMLATGCATTRQQAPFQPVDLNPELRSGTLVPRVGGFLVVLDASASMSQRYQGMAKIHHAVNFLDQMNRTLPNLNVTAGMRVFGKGAGMFDVVSNRVYGMTGYSQQDLGAVINAIDSAGGNSPMDVAVKDAGEDLAQIPNGKIAAILVSDGHELGSGPIEAARGAKARYGDRLCIYTVLVGDSAVGQALMNQLADIGGCGFSISADAINTPPDMADFVKTVFMAQNEVPLDADGDGVADADDKCPGTPPNAVVDTQGCLPDSDKDGIPDVADRCPGTPKGYAVDNNGCPPDSDGDIVWDVLDKCPGTPAGAAVDNVGCPQDNDKDGVADYRDQCPGTPMGATVDARGCWVLDDVQFASGRQDINAAAAAQLDKVAAILKSNPGLSVEVQGHTDNTGPEKANQILSEKRARAVADYLAAHGVSANRLRARGLGESRPIAVNDTPEGRAMNRRVEIAPVD
jgi:OOP family OmpA-OmpF porin